MYRSSALVPLFSLVASVLGQQVGTQTAETHPALSWQQCSAGGSCTSQSGKVVLDSNWRWLHTTSGYTNCYTGNAWDTSLCPDPQTCAKNCALDGADYSGTYGITTSGNALTLKFKTNSNVGSRVYLMASDTAYQMFKPLNKEFTFDVDLSALGCGLNGAVYFSAMDADGGMAKNAGNKAGAKYGTGYCDSQCPHDIKFINGEANILDWTGSSTNSGTGRYGACCSEMDIWEANNISSAYTPHGCTKQGLYRCSGTECGDEDRHGGVCDKDGCDFNSYRMGVKNFYGKGMTVDTSKKITVVTQFLTDNGTDTGKLSEIRRYYVQNNVIIPNSFSNIPGMAAYDSVTEAFCTAQKSAFGDVNDFANKGGFTPMSQAMSTGMVLVLSVWDDYAVGMLWLDSTYPTDGSGPGVERGTCPTDSGKPEDVESQQANAQVIYSNIKFGPIGSTVAGLSSASAKPPSSTARPPSSTARPPSSTARPPSSTAKPGAPLYGQCGGQGWTGPTTCAQGTCKYSNAWYSQCLP